MLSKIVFRMVEKLKKTKKQKAGIQTKHKSLYHMTAHNMAILGIQSLLKV